MSIQAIGKWLIQMSEMTISNLDLSVYRKAYVIEKQIMFTGYVFRQEQPVKPPQVCRAIGDAW